MKITQIIPGAGGAFYCGNCLRDSNLVKGLRTLGHVAKMVPMYLPIFMDEEVEEDKTPVFFGAVNLYLKQQIPAFRHAPHWAEKLLDSAPMLKLAARFSGSTDANGLEDMTLSMLEGEKGAQAEDLEKLVVWLKEHEKPDVIHLANALLLGLARRLKEELKVPVVCSLQDEDIWVDEMDDEFAKMTWDTMAERAKDVDAFIAVSQFYADQMHEKMRIPKEKMHVVHVGIEMNRYKGIEADFENQTVGYLSRLHPCLGLGILIDAFILIKKDPAFGNLKLKLTGGMTGADKKFVHHQKKKLSEYKLLHDVDFIERFDKEDRLEFLKSISLMSVPMIRGEAFGTFQLEALGAGIPLVQPNTGAFPEIIEATGGGIIYDPNTPEALADAMKSLLNHPERAKSLGKKGKESVHKYFTHDYMAQQIAKVYHAVSKM